MRFCGPCTSATSRRGTRRSRSRRRALRIKRTGRVRRKPGTRRRCCRGSCGLILGHAADGKGFVLVDGDVSIVKDNKVVGTRHSVNMLLVLGFDVYRQDPETTIGVVKGEGYDLSKLHEDTWEGHPAYVVGADKGDLKSKQFWVAKDTLLFVRVIEPARGDATKVDDIRFMDYRPLAGAWIAARVEVHSEGKKVFSEDYTDIQANVKLDPAVFEAEKFAATHWEKP